MVGSFVRGAQSIMVALMKLRPRVPKFDISVLKLETNKKRMEMGFVELQFYLAEIAAYGNT